MAEYISREELIKALETDYNRSWCSKPQGVEEYVEGARDEYDDVLKIICAMAAADVQPVVYAHKTINVGRRSYCSNCGKLAIMEDFCSKCGAKVKDGEQNDT